MFKRLAHITFIIFVLVQLLSCKKPPDWPAEPVISQEANTVYLNTLGTDTIIFTIAFQDGDGNLGLEEFDTLTPYQNYDIVEDSAGNPKRLVSINDFNIYHHEISDIDDDGIRDTFEVVRNEFKDNIWFDFIQVNELDEIIDTLDFENYTPVGIRNFNSQF